jgi:hypothetical protein
MIHVEISSAGAPANADISQYVKDPPDRWGPVRFTVNSGTDTCDVFVVIDNPHRGGVINTRHTVYATAEVLQAPFTGERLDALRGYDRIYSSHDIAIPTAMKALPFQPHMVNANHGTFNRPHVRNLSYLLQAAPKKTKPLSMIVSTKHDTPGHAARFEFAVQLKAHFGHRLDWYGNGINAIAEKWEGLAPYRYTIAIENHVAPDVITEKLADPFITLTHPFYVGAPNALRYYDQHAYTPIHLHDVDRAIDIIERRITSAPAQWPLIDARNKALLIYNPYSQLAAIAQGATRSKPAMAERQIVGVPA